MEEERGPAESLGIKTVQESFNFKLAQWDAIRKKIESCEQEIAQIEDELKRLPRNGENRVKRADLTEQLHEKRAWVAELKSKFDMIDYLSCLGKVLRNDRSSTPTPSIAEKRRTANADAPNPKRRKTAVAPNKGKKGIFFKVPETKEQQRIHVLDREEKEGSSKRPRETKRGVFKDKKIAFLQSCTMDADLLQFVKKPQNDAEQDIEKERSKKLAIMLKEIPLDTTDAEFCPFCPEVPLEYAEKAQSVSCPKCGLTRDVLDITHTNVNEKTYANRETTSHNTHYRYQSRLYFQTGVKRITNELRGSIPKHVEDAVRFQLAIDKVKDVNDVTWQTVHKALKKLAKTDKEYPQYYPHVPQITNIIRGSPIITLSEKQKQEIYETYDLIYPSWIKYKKEERSNFMSSAIAMILCFKFLNYPEELQKMFSLLKGQKNLEDYDEVVENICRDIMPDKEPIRISEMVISKYGKTDNVLLSLRSDH